MNELDAGAGCKVAIEQLDGVRRDALPVARTGAQALVVFSRC